MTEEKKHGYLLADNGYDEEEFIGIDYFESEIGEKYEVVTDSYLSNVAVVLTPINKS